MQQKNAFTFLAPGHSACAGCGEILAMRHVLIASGRNTIVANATGCSEVTTSKYPTSAFNIPWIHANFENAAPVASGIAAALKVRNAMLREPQHDISSEPQHDISVICFGGDGATFDIGLGMLSGMWERGENILYVCFDNEAYMNTGIQASAATPIDANTTTTQPGIASYGNEKIKKDMLAIALSHQCAYVASATVGDVLDIERKVKKALSIKGPKYLQILVTCVPGWYTDSKDTVKVARLAQQTGIYPVLEYVAGKLTASLKCPTPRPAVTDYLSLQGRFKHLFKDEKGKQEIAKIQQLADENCEKFKL